MIRRSVLSLLLCYLLTACHGKAAIATGGITAGVGLIGGAGNQDSSTADGAVVLIPAGIGIMIYGLATLHHGEQQVYTGTAPPPPAYQQPGPRPYPYPGQQQPPYPCQQPPPPGPNPSNPPPVPEPPLPAQDLSIADPHLKEMAIKASSAARKNDC